MSFPVEEQITRVEALYHQLTGSSPVRREAPLYPIPAGRDPYETVLSNLRRLDTRLEQMRAVGSASVVAPRVTIFENEQSLTFLFEVPGVKKSDVRVDLTRGALRISGTRDPIRVERDGMRQIYSETPMGTFERVIPVPEHLDDRSVEARLEAGLLVVTFRRDSTERRRDTRIEVA